VLLLESCAFGGLLGRQSPFVGIRTGHSLSRSRWSWRCGRLHGSGHRRHTRFLLALGRLARAHRRWPGARLRRGRRRLLPGRPLIRTRRLDRWRDRPRLPA
jgi:hypothetical protein